MASAKCAGYLAKGRIQEMHDNPSFTTETQAACDIERIKKGLPKPPGSLGGRRRNRSRRMRGGAPGDDCPTAGNLKANGVSRYTMANSAACTLKARLGAVKSSGLGRGGRSRRGRSRRGSRKGRKGRHTRRH